jgi:hypothetical protein
MAQKVSGGVIPKPLGRLMISWAGVTFLPARAPLVEVRK